MMWLNCRQRFASLSICCDVNKSLMDSEQQKELWKETTLSNSENPSFMLQCMCSFLNQYVIVHSVLT